MTQLNQLLGKVGNALGAGEIQEISNKTGRTYQDIINQAISKGVDVSSGARNVFTQSQVNQQQQQAIANAPANTTPSFSYSPQRTISAVTYTPTAPPPPPPSSGGGGGVAAPQNTAYLEEIKAANALALQTLMNEGSAYGWDAQRAINNVSQAAETERTKLLGENALAVTAAESQGRLDLQKIVNAGMQNVTRIERGADMMRGITSMFNF